MWTEIRAIVICAAAFGAALAPPAATQAQTSSLTAQQERMKSCNADAATRKLAGDARKTFVNDCLSGKTATNPASRALSSADAPPEKATKAKAATAANLGAGQYASESDARRRCAGDQVVWANTDTRIFHLAGTRFYGNTKQGAYMCRKDSERSGFQAASRG